MCSRRVARPARDRLRGLVLSVLLGLAVTFLPPAADAHDDICTWSGSVSTRWDNKDNWSQCDDGIPQSHDRVAISGGTFPPLISSSVVVRRLELSGTRLNIVNGATLSVKEEFRSTGGATIHLNGTIEGPMTFGSGTTTVDATGTLDGPVTIGGLADPMATLDIADGSAIVATGNLTINSAVPFGGTLGKPGGTGQLLFEGARLTNNGTIHEHLTFRRPGVQTIAGTGAWQGIPRLMITAGSRATLANPITVSATRLDVTNRGVLALDTHTLTLRDTPNVKVELESAIDGSGTVKAETDTILALDGVMTPTLELAQAITVTVDSAGRFAGDVVVPAGATLNLRGAPSVDGRVMLDGVMTGTGSMVYRGPSFANNGRVTARAVTFGGSAQTLSGTGYFSPTTQATIAADARVALGSDHRLGRLLITPNGTLDITGRTLSLMGDPVPLVRHGTFTTTNSTVVYSATIQQTVTAGATTYHNLTLRNAAGTQQDALPLNVKGELRVERGRFTMGAADAGTVRIDGGATLATRPGTTATIRGAWTNDGTFAAGADSLIAFDAPAAPRIEGASETAFDGLRIAGSGATLKTSAEVARLLVLDANLTTDGTRLTLALPAITRGQGDVVGTVRRTGPFAPSVAYSFGNPNVQLTFADKGTLPSEVLVTLALTEPRALGQAVARTYAITPTGGTGYAATLRLRYLDAEVPNRPEADLLLWRLDGPKQRWERQGRTRIDTTANWIELAGAVTGPAQWAIAPSPRLWLPLIWR